ncbi:MFS transporter [Aliiroseovarius sp.]|uniref:MFS transporter n=1 Tax=Aliiroseovarius sp. TaxID=1872442 RepID=UPI003BAB58B8
MIGVLGNRTYRHLFGAQMVALTGTGLATVALGLLAYHLAGDRAGLVLGTALTIKMVAYVLVAPVAAALAERLDRRRMLVALDLVRAGVALCLPFVTEVWQVYVLIFLLQSASAGFTPAFQASIPDVLPDEDDYTSALSLSRLAMDMESLLSPMLAAALLTLVSFDNLFWGTAMGFMASAALVVSVALPSPRPTARRGIYDRTTRGLRLYLATPRLRALLALNGVISSIGAMVIVNTVVVVRADLGLGESAVALALAGFGLGSMSAAMGLPRVLKTISDRRVMLAGGVFGTATLAGMAMLWSVGPLPLAGLALGWAGIGMGYSAMLTPSGRLIARSGPPEDRPALFAAQFTLSHACWLAAYPLAGVLITGLGSAWAMGTLALSAALCLAVAWRIWPRGDT